MLCQMVMYAPQSVMLRLWCLRCSMLRARLNLGLIAAREPGLISNLRHSTSFHRSQFIVRASTIALQ